MEKNVPKLRFPGFTDAWEQRKFGDLADYKKGPFGSAITKDIFVPKGDGAVKVYEQQNAINKDWSLERYFLPKEYALTKLKSFEVHGGDIIVSCAGTIGEIYEIPEVAESGVINQALMRVRVNENIVDKKMFIISFSNMIDDFTRAHSNGSAIKNIPPFADLKPMEVLIPSINEQRKISGFFEGIDNLITLHQRKCDEIKNLKKCMLQKMFPKEGEQIPEIRFPRFTEPWEQRKLGEKTEFVTGKSFSQELSDNGIYCVMDMGTVSQEGIRIETKKTNIQRDVLKQGDLIMPKDDIGGGLIIGRTAYIPSDNQYVLGDHVYRLRFDNDNGLFIHYQVNSDYVRKQVMPLVTGSAQLGLNSKNIQGVTISLPSYKEQMQIGEFFANLDNLITLHQRKLESIKELKKSLLQQMII